MRVGTIIFAYTRYEHLKILLENLKAGDRLPEYLLVFQDGVKDETDRKNWTKVNKMIKNIDWCSVDFIEWKTNKGLADSIVDGINYAFETCDAIIVLEDDCIPEVGFISYMYQCLDKYKNNSKIYAVNGYTEERFTLSCNESDDIFFTGRTLSWGWGTWQDRWLIYDRDYMLLKKLKMNKNQSRWLSIWGNDLEDMLIGNVQGRTNSWAVFWSLAVINNKGLCVNPRKSLINNIGFDGTGVHTGMGGKPKIIPDSRRQYKFFLPVNPMVNKKIVKSFVSKSGSYTAIANHQCGYDNIIVYGVETLKNRVLEKKINDKYNIVAILDESQKGFYAGKPLVTYDVLGKLDYDKIIIAETNFLSILRIIKKLVWQHNVKIYKVKAFLKIETLEELINYVKRKLLIGG